MGVGQGEVGKRKQPCGKVACTLGSSVCLNQPQKEIEQTAGRNGLQQNRPRPECSDEACLQGWGLGQSNGVLGKGVTHGG